MSQKTIPNYAEIEVPNTSLALKYKQREVYNVSIKDERKYL